MNKNNYLFDVLFDAYYKVKERKEQFILKNKMKVLEEKEIKNSNEDIEKDISSCEEEMEIIKKEMNKVLNELYKPKQEPKKKGLFTRVDY